MITLTRLDGKDVCVNEINILWVEALPDTAVMLLGGGRILVKESVEEVKNKVNELLQARLPLSEAATGGASESKADSQHETA